MKLRRSDFRYTTAALFDQQMWCLGRDIARREGNVLLNLGMCRYQPQDTVRDSSMYTASITTGGSLFLWAFGAMYTEPGMGGVFVPRFRFAPRLTTRETGLGVFNVEQLGPIHQPKKPQEYTKMRTLLPNLLGWFAKYEHWVSENLTVKYREACLAQWSKTASVPAQKMAAAWEVAAKKCKNFQTETNALAGSPLRQFSLNLKPIQPASSNIQQRPSTRVKT